MKKILTYILFAPIALNTTQAQTTQRNGLSEEFSASTCHPCKNLFDIYHPITDSLGVNDTAMHINALNYQMDYPGAGDLSYNLHAQQRYDYCGVTGLPTLRINGRGVYTESTSPQLRTALDTSRNQPSVFKISGSYEIAGANLNINVNVLPLVTMTGKYRVHIAAAERHYTNNATTVNMPEYYFVMRRMFPDGKGKAEYSWTANVAKTYSYTQAYAIANPPAQGSFDFWNNPYVSDLVVFVQDSITKEILQSQVIKARWPLGINDVQQVNNIICYPNPAKDIIHFGFTISKPITASLSIISLTGKIVFYTPAKQYLAGAHQLNVPVNFASGLYHVSLNAEGKNYGRMVEVEK